jgi:sRNA-binding regulator protein Hfq
MEYVMAYEEFLTEHKSKKTELNVFLSNKTMLQGKITDFDESCIILDKCFIRCNEIISITPQKK